MIDISRESCFRLAEAPRHLPSRNGKRVSTSTVFRWAQRGVQGCRLEVIRIGGALHTSTEALQRFANVLTNKKYGSDNPSTDDTKGRHRCAEAETKLEQMGF